MTQREAYLDALGIDRWERRNGAPPAHPEQAPGTATTPNPAKTVKTTKTTKTTKTPEPAPVASPREAPSSAALGLSLGPGQGSCLFVCGSEDDASSALASDLARLLPEAPVWARTALNGDGTSLEAAISERLFTCVVFFGQAQAVLALGGEAPQQCGPARVAVVPELRRLAQEGESRRVCWEALKGLGLGRA